MSIFFFIFEVSLNFYNFLTVLITPNEKEFAFTS